LLLFGGIGALIGYAVDSMQDVSAIPSHNLSFVGANQFEDKIVYAVMKAKESGIIKPDIAKYALDVGHRVLEQRILQYIHL